MPADRFLHPRAGYSEKVSALSSDVYRVWTQYILSADDFGVMRASAITLRDQNGYFAGKPEKQVQRWLEAVVASGLLQTFQHQGRSYLFQWDWQTWQKVEYPRMTLQPAPPPGSRAFCNDVTRMLFDLHPGGAGKKFRKRSENLPEPTQEDFQKSTEISAATRETANGLRLTANGKRLTANGSEGAAVETNPPMDEWLLEFRKLYPPQGISGSYMTEHAFVAVLLADPSIPPRAAFEALKTRLAGHVRSHQWRVKGMIPRMDRYLSEGWHLQVLPEFSPDTLVNDKTTGTLGAAAAILGGKV